MADGWPHTPVPRACSARGGLAQWSARRTWNSPPTSVTSTRSSCSALPRTPTRPTRLSLGRGIRGEIALATDAYEQAVGLLSMLDEKQIAVRIDTLFAIGWAGWALRGSAEAERHFAHGLALSRASGWAQLLIQLMCGRSSMLRFLGRLAEALTLSDECLEAAQVTESPTALALAQRTRCQALTASGQLGGAVSAGEQAVATARTVNISLQIGSAVYVYGEALVEAGEHQRAIDVMLDLLGGPELPRWSVVARPGGYEVLVYAELALGNQAEADGWARRAASIAARTQLPINAAAAGRSRAAVLFAQCDAARAAVCAERSVAHAEACDMRLDAARGRLLAGRAHAAAANRERAGELLRAAEVQFAEFGAQRWRAQAVRELRRIGRRVHRSAQRATPGGDGIDSLSGREREVARLVCEHRTNREIASMLFLSEKTVESHMRSIFVKLGAQTRAEVARTLQPAI
jgi:DNA-binding CsgD family transcriptional regulator/tetratricopeptide (TPR) repeat protein